MLCYRSVEFSISFPKYSGLKALIAFCNNYKFTSMLAEQNQYVLETMMFCMNFLSRYSGTENVQMWSESSVNLVNHLIKISKLNLARSNLVLVAGIYCVIGNLAKDDVIKQLSDLPIVTRFLLTDVISIADEMKAERYVPKDQLQFYNDGDDEDNKIIECDVSIEKKSLAPVTGKLYALARLCATDNIRVLISQRMDSLKQLLYRGNDIEKLHVLRLLIRVCQDDKCARFVLSDRELYEYLKDLRHITSDQAPSNDYKNICDQLIDYSDNYITRTTAKLKSKSKSKISASNFNSGSSNIWSPAPTTVNRNSRQPARSNSMLAHSQRPQPPAPVPVSSSSMSTSRLSRNREPDPPRYAADTWTEKQVDEWFDQINLNPIIRNTFAPCDGKILRQISKMRPEFVYQIFNTENGNKINLRELAVFYYHLEKLFPASSYRA